MQIVGKLKFKKTDSNKVVAGFFGMAMAMDNNLISINEIPIRNNIIVIKLNLNLIIESIEK